MAPQEKTVDADKPHYCGMQCRRTIETGQNMVIETGGRTGTGYRHADRDDCIWGIKDPATRARAFQRAGLL